MPCTRVSQGVNITLTFDDVLELIYAQVCADHPHLALSTSPSTTRSTIISIDGFVVEDNERLPARENLPFPSNMGLVPEVIHRARTILTQDYARECQAHGVSTDLEGIFAWMGVPLNAGAESIGALSVGSRDPGTLYCPRSARIAAGHRRPDGRRHRQGPPPPGDPAARPPAQHPERCDSPAYLHAGVGTPAPEHPAKRGQHSQLRCRNLLPCG